MDDIKIENIRRGWFCPEEIDENAIKFSYKDLPGYILLAKDRQTDKMYNIHFIDIEKLKETEKELLVRAVTDFLESGDYLGTCGIYWPGHELEYKRFSWRTDLFTDTGMIRVLKDSNNSLTAYFPILKKH